MMHKLFHLSVAISPFDKKNQNTLAVWLKHWHKPITTVQHFKEK